MLTETIHNDIRYTLSNDNLQVGDKVFPIAYGRVNDDDIFLLHELDFSQACSGFPDEPHTIQNLKHSDYKPYQVSTDFGFSPIEVYFKIIKKEKHIKIKGTHFDSYKWVEIQ